MLSGRLESGQYYLILASAEKVILNGLSKFSKFWLAISGEINGLGEG
jgi:hypothetical protein